MRRLWVLALVLAAIPAAAAYVPLLSGGAVQCAMACHGGASVSGASCCLLGPGAGSTIASCSGSRDGVPPAPVCRLYSPNPSATLERPLLALLFEASVLAALMSRPPRPLDPVPLALS